MYFNIHTCKYIYTYYSVIDLSNSRVCFHDTPNICIAYGIPINIPTHCVLCTCGQFLLGVLSFLITVLCLW